MNINAIAWIRRRYIRIQFILAALTFSIGLLVSLTEYLQYIEKDTQWYWVPLTAFTAVLICGWAYYLVVLSVTTIIMLLWHCPNCGKRFTSWWRWDYCNIETPPFSRCIRCGTTFDELVDLAQLRQIEPK